MKKLLSVVFAVVLLISVAPTDMLNTVVSATTNYTEDYYTYTVDDTTGQTTITDVDAEISGDVTIPSTLGGYPVTSIGNYAFYACDSLKSISIPDSVTNIGNNTFIGCTGLTTIIVESGNIVYHSKDNCLIATATNELILGCKNSVIPNYVTAIGEHAFYNCLGLTNINIPDSVTNIGNSAFSNCSNLTSITISDSITSISDYAFYNCSNLTRVNIPNGVTEIGFRSFNYCSSITSITIPDSVTKINDCAFSECSSLMSITIPNSVTSIGRMAFCGCSESLESIMVNVNNPKYYSNGNCIIDMDTNKLVLGCKNSIIPNTVTSIGEYAFYGCDSFTHITIPNGVISIDKYAFRDCKNLSSIYLPSTLTKISSYAFLDCNILVDVYYDGSEAEKKNISLNSLIDATWHYNMCDNKTVHEYDNDCDATCNKCNNTRNTNHAYDDCFDATCNACGSIRNTNHTYDNDCDAECNVCGVNRDIKHIFVKAGENTATCNKCNLSKTFGFIITTDETITLSYDASKEFDFEIENMSIAKISNVSSSIVSIGSYYKQASSAKVLSVYPGETVVKIVTTNGTVLTTNSLLVVEGEHQMQLSEVLKEVTCTESGKELHKCKFCDYQEEKTIENPGHTYEDTCDAECNVCGDVREITFTGWHYDSVNWYYFENGNKVVSDWRKDSKGWVYLGKDGAMLTNAWCTDSQGWCYVGADGYAVTNCWKKDSFGWIWLNDNGSMTKNAWIKDGGKWYWLDANGYMASNCWKKDSKGWVYLGKDGAMLTNAWCTDSQGWCYVGADGYAVTNCWKKDSIGWIWLNGNGSMTKNAWIKDGGKWYYLDSNGYMLSNTSRYIKNKTYYFNSSGVCTNP